MYSTCDCLPVSCHLGTTQHACGDQTAVGAATVLVAAICLTGGTIHFSQNPLCE
jgi:hypothetical protein